MNITELDNYKLSDAVKFHNRLNPRLWGKDERLLPEVRSKLLEIAADFQEFLGVSDLELEDITISGSNAAYSYTPHSDIDLHIVVSQPQQHDEVYQELFNAKKYQYNDMHDIRIHGADVELYVQPADQTPVSLGEFSIKNNKWLQVPRRKRAKIDQDVVRHKYEDLAARIKSALTDDNADRIQNLISKIKAMRQTGLDQHGEFGPENLAFKMLRTQGLIKKLYDAQAAARDRELSLKEQNKVKKTVKYGFGTSRGQLVGETDTGELQGSSIGDSGAQSTWDGVSPSTQEFLNEDDTDSIVQDFIADTAKRLGIKTLPTVKLHHTTEWSESNHSFGMYEPESHTLHVSLPNRHLLDVLRTTAHELTHCRQNELQELPDNAGDTGSKWENQANAQAGAIMRDYAERYPERFEKGTVGESSGYIPTARQKKDPRFSTALTVDIKPGQIGKEANKMALKTDAQGAPALLIKGLKNALREFKESGRMPQPSQGPGKYRDLNEPLGPESPPKMPAGTIKVDVSDTQDWYQLGQDISDLDHADKSHYNQGPPHTVIAFGSEELENMYSHKLKRLGLPTHDLDEPGEEDLDEELTEAQLMEIKMTGKNLRAEAAKTGAQAGMEFEMIVPNVESDVEPEMEPDMDQDQRTRSFSDIRDFFHDGDYNGRRQVDNLMDEIAGEYEDWMQEQTAEQWERDGVDYIRDFVEVNDLFDRSEFLDQARDEVVAANPDLPSESEDFQQLVNARLNELQEQFVLEAFEDRGSIYDDAFEAFAEEQRDEYDERSFLDDRYQTMSDIQSNFDIAWPYYYDINADQDGDMDGQQVADEFSSYMGKPVNYSSQYHGGRREPGTYVVEPDGSLEGDNPGDGGLEFVSPPMPIDEMISDLNKVKEWAGQQGVYTNDSTGLHINISVPDYSIDKLDYVKLAILMGDEYILDLFGRSGNTYAKSAMGKIKSALKQKPEAAAQIMDLMKQGLDGAATKAIHTGITDKYTSINTKTGYIEFRSPGGDWLDSNFDKIENTLLRFTVALSAAINPEAYRKEYLTKLYKLLSEGMADKSDVNVIQLFSNYSAGELDKPALIRQVRAKQLARNVAKGKATGKMWWDVSRPGYMSSIEVVASSKEEAIDVALQPGNYPNWAGARNTLQAKPLRPYQEEPKGPTLNGRPSNPDGNFIIVRAQNQTVPVYRYMASDGADSLTVLRQWIAANPGQQWTFRRDTDKEFGQPGAPAQPAQPAQPAADNQGNWGLWMAYNNRFIRQPGQIDYNVIRRFPSQAAAMAFLERTREENPQMRTDVEVREIPADYTPGSTPVAPAQPVNRNTLAPTGPGPWEVFRISDGSSVAELGQTNRMGAEVEARRVIDQRREAPELYGVRTVSTPVPGSTVDLQRQRAAQQNDQAQGGTVDVAGEQPAAPQTLTRPGQAQQQWTGEWLVLDPNGRELHRFSGIGNVQADANRHAVNWLRAHPGAMQAGVTVVPEMA